MSRTLYHSLNITSGNTLSSPQATVGNLYISGTNLGINTTSPANTLHVHNTTAPIDVRLILTDSAIGVGSSSGLTLIKNGAQIGYLWNYSNAPLIIGTNNTQTITISTSGNVGIGTSNPTTTLTVNGNISSPNFNCVQVFNGTTSWTGGVNSSNFTVGAGTKLIYANFSYWSTTANPGTIYTYFDIYTSTGTLVSTITADQFWINLSGTHMGFGFNYVISNATMPAGTYYIRARTSGGTSDANDYMYLTLVNLPF
jgi:hypothetical protein